MTDTDIDKIDKVVAEMPKVDVPTGVSLCKLYRDKQCRLLAEAGYRPVRSKEEIEEKLCELEYKWPLYPNEMAEGLRRQWLEGK